MLALAGELVARGHRATFLHQRDAAPLVTGHDVGFRALGALSHPAGHLAGVVRRMARADSLFGLNGVIRDVAAATDMLAREMPAACRSLGIDMIVSDQTEAAGGLVARRLDLPQVSIANALPLNREPGMPPPFTSWQYDPSDWGRERNLGGYRVSDWLMGRHARVIAGYAATWHLGPLRTIEDCGSPLAQISQMVAGFDMPRANLPAHVHYVGPLRGAADRHRGFVMPARDGRPLVYASLGTLQGGRLPLFRRIAKVAAQLDLQLVLAHGGKLGPAEIGSLPGKPAVFDFVPQAEMLRHASLAILNGGLNTVMDALASGRPIVAIPIAFEQGAIAARLTRVGAGLRVGRGPFKEPALARAVRTILSEPRFSQAAGRIATEIAAAGGVARAADIIETVLLTGRPVLRDDIHWRQERPTAAMLART